MRIVCRVRAVWATAESYSSIKIVGGSVVSPDQDLIRELIEIRKKKQSEMKQFLGDSPEHKKLDIIQDQLKIVANAVSYGIFMEVNSESLEKPIVDAHGLNHRSVKVKKRETSGKFYQPIISTMLTSGARLMLAIAETWLQQHNGEYTFCDTDSMAVSPSKAESLTKFFQPLNPYSFDNPLFKIEDVNFENGKLRDLWFYGISAKRYTLFKYENGKPAPIDNEWSSHGLGHLEIENKYEWQKTLWKNILDYEHSLITKEELFENYRGEYSVNQLFLTTKNLYNRVKTFNRNKSLDKQIKPYNFTLAGSPIMLDENNEPIYPLTSFTKNYDQAPYQPFIDAHTGKLYNKHTHHYWNTLDKMIEDYIDHPESKFKNGNKTGKMRRRHVFVKKIIYIGKETNELEETEILGINRNSYAEYGSKT